MAEEIDPCLLVCQQEVGMNFERIGGEVYLVLDPIPVEVHDFCIRNEGGRLYLSADLPVRFMTSRVVDR